jgi:hypothetical protein
MIRSKKIRDSAKGEECTLKSPGACNYDAETTVLCHFTLHNGGSAKLNGDLSAGYGCSGCHDAIDGRKVYDWMSGDKEFYMRRSMVRTLDRLVDKGIVVIT